MSKQTLVCDDVYVLRLLSMLVSNVSSIDHHETM